MGILAYQRVGAVLVDHLTFLSWWCSDVQIPIPDGHTRVRTIGPKKKRDWCYHRCWCRCGSPDEMPCVPKSIQPGVSWTKITLAAWSRGFLPWRGPWRGATGAHRCSWPCIMYVCLFAGYNTFNLLWWQSMCFKSSVWPMYLF